MVNSVFCRVIICTLLLASMELSLAESPRKQANEYAEIQKIFPNSVKINEKAKPSFFEFCPDNTCDLLEVKEAISKEYLIDIGYLYLYYYSEYIELEEWRKSAKAYVIAQKILRKYHHDGCIGISEDRKKSLCIFKKSIRKFNISLYFVRYDEGKRHRVKKPIDELFVKSN